MTRYVVIKQAGGSEQIISERPMPLSDARAMQDRLYADRPAGDDTDYMIDLSDGEYVSAYARTYAGAGGGR